MAMQTLCERSWELRPLCETLLGRLVAICGYTDHFRPLPERMSSEGTAPAATALQWPVQVDAALSRFTLLLERLAATESAVFRLAGAPSPVCELRVLHVWMDAAFRAVAVPAGHHVVRFRYEPGSVRTGVWLSLIALIALLVAALWRPGRGVRWRLPWTSRGPAGRPPARRSPPGAPRRS